MKKIILITASLVFFEVYAELGWEYDTQNNQVILGHGYSDNPNQAYMRALWSSSSSPVIGDVVIPSSFTFGIYVYPVVQIREYAFYNSGMYYNAYAYCFSKISSFTVPESVTSIGDYAFGLCSAVTNVTLPSNLTSISKGMFYGCSSLMSAPISSSMTSIGDSAFSGCSSLASIMIPTNVVSIGDSVFSDCCSLTSVTIPSNVTSVGRSAFSGCKNLRDVYIERDDLSISADAFSGCNSDLIIHVPEKWQGRGRTICGYSIWKGEGPNDIVTLTTTNVVIHYLMTNVPVNVVAPISKDTAIVNVMTEIEGGNIAIPDTWAKNYPDFTKRFGSDFSAALTKYTGKYDGAGNPLFVWQDYVAGTDPTDLDDVFIATITMVEGKPQVQWDPVLVETEAAKRVYTKYGKVKLQDEEWEVISEGEESNYNFFKVTVKMK